ncbi:MAG: cytochrome c biogenesis protein CcsA [Betaproteobacteria bacterium]|nr:cytochrome c biogenesis protein CcsA [Betaproteobacteria bacterium]
MDSILFAGAALCFAVCAARIKAGWPAPLAGAGVGLVCLALFAARTQLAASFHIGHIAAVFAVLAAAVLLVIDFRLRFVRSWRIIPAFASGAALMALLPLPGHVLADASLLWIGHALPAALSYACFAVAIAQLLDVHWAISSLRTADARQPEEGNMPLLQMESSAFATIYFAFALLTATLASGIVLNYVAEAPLLDFNHKHLFALLTWLASLVLIAGRLLWGWRGNTALHWLTAAGLFLLLSYMGTVFVLDVILGRQGT